MTPEMQTPLVQDVRKTIAYILCISLFVGLICSKFLISLSMIAFVVVGLFSPTLKIDIHQLWKNKGYTMTLGIFLLFLISSMMSTNMEAAIVRLRIALPLFFLPIAFALLPPFSKKEYQQLLFVFLFGMSLACLGVLINYGLNYEEMQQLLVVSKAIPTPNGDHIRFSLMINLAVFAGFWLLQEQFCWRHKNEKWLIGALVLFLMLTLHLLSVRIGMVILYLGISITMLYYMLYKRYYWLGLVLIGGILVVPYLAYRYVPSIQTKVDLTRHNWNMYQQGTYGEYSDTRRLLSYEIAWDVAKQAPWLGVGVGDLNDEQARLYQKKYPDQKVMYPHNFFLTIYAATGILGLLFFLVCFFFPFFYHKQYRNLFFLLFYLTIFLSFMTENTLLNAIGVGIYSFFLLFSINYLEGERRVAVAQPKLN